MRYRSDGVLLDLTDLARQEHRLMSTVGEVIFDKCHELVESHPVTFSTPTSHVAIPTWLKPEWVTSDWDWKWIKLATTGQRRDFLTSYFSTIWLEPKYTEVWSEKAGFVPFGANLTHFRPKYGTHESFCYLLYRLLADVPVAYTMAVYTWAQSESVQFKR